MPGKEGEEEGGAGEVAAGEEAGGAGAGWQGRNSVKWMENKQMTEGNVQQDDSAWGTSSQRQALAKGTVGPRGVARTSQSGQFVSHAETARKGLFFAATSFARVNITCERHGRTSAGLRRTRARCRQPKGTLDAYLCLFNEPLHHGQLEVVRLIVVKLCCLILLGPHPLWVEPWVGAIKPVVG